MKKIKFIQIESTYIADKKAKMAKKMGFISKDVEKNMGKRENAKALYTFHSMLSNGFRSD